MKQFIDDLHEVVTGHYANHFLGTIIYSSTKLSAFIKESSIIDGQQRLTTTFLFLYAVRDIFLKQGDNDSAENLETQYLTNKNKDIRLKLKPLVTDDNVYQKIVKKDIYDLVESERKSNVWRNYLYITNRICLMINEGHTIDDILLAFDKLYIVCVPLSKEDNPQKIFESINSTGARLTAADLIRNYILMPIQSTEQDKYYKEYWKPIERNLMNDSKRLELFFRMFLAIKTGALANIGAVYKEFQKWYEEERKAKEISDILSEVKNYSDYYFRINSAPITNRAPMSEALKTLRKVGVDLPAPLVVGFYALLAEGKITDDTFIDAVNMVNTYLIRRALCALSTGSISRIFTSVFKSVMEVCDGNYENALNVMKKHLVNVNRDRSTQMPGDKDLRNTLLNANMYIVKETLRIVLENIEMEGNSAPVDLSKLSVEHLMPQDGSKWLRKHPRIKKDDYDSYRNRLGNLTLVSKADNSRAKNNIWDKKKEMFASTGHLKLNEAILLKKTWDFVAIDERSKVLADKIIAMFPYFEEVGGDDDMIRIHLKSDDPDFVANAIFYCDNGCVDILADSMIAARDDGEIEKYQYLIDDIVDKDATDGFVFKKDFSVQPNNHSRTALSIAAGLLLNRKVNGKDYWFDESEQAIRTNALFIDSKFGTRQK